MEICPHQPMRSKIRKVSTLKESNTNGPSQAEIENPKLPFEKST